MKIGYIRVSKAEGVSVFDKQQDALVGAGVDPTRIFTDRTDTNSDDRPGLANCLKALREKDTLIVWHLDRLGRNLKHLVDSVHRLEDRDIELCVLNGFDAEIITTTPEGKVIYQTFRVLAEFERLRLSELTKAGLKAAAKRGRKGGRKYALTPDKIRVAQAALKDQNADIEAICKDIGVSRPTLYRYMDSSGNLREAGKKVLKSESKTPI